MKHSQENIGWNLPVVGRYRFGFILGALLLLCAVLSLLASTSASALTTVPTKMNFQGRLTDNTGNIKANGTYNMKLRLYTVNSGGTAVWTEDRLVSAGNGVTVTNGLFSIQLGSVTTLPASLFASGALYLEVELPTPATATTSGTPTWTEGAMTPRNQMATSAYAYNSETLDGMDSAAFGQVGAQNYWLDDQYFNYLEASGGAFFSGATETNFTSPVALLVRDGTGNVLTADTTNRVVRIGAVTADAAGVVLVLDTKNTAGDPTGTNGAMYYNSNLGKMRCYQSGGWVDCINSNANTLDGLDSTDFARLGTSNLWTGTDNRYDFGKIEMGISGGTSAALLNITSQGTSYAAQGTVVQGCTGGAVDNGSRCIVGPSGNAPCAPYEFEVNGECYEDIGPNTYTTYTCPSGGTLSGAAGFENRCVVSTDLIKVENSGGLDIFRVSSDFKVQIGSGTSDSTAVVLILDKSSGSSDPTGATGAMYYNTTMKRFRCFGDTKWVDCRTTAASNTTVQSVTNTVTETNFTSNYAVEGNECVPGRMYEIKARGIYSQAALATNLTLRLKLGSTVLATTGAQAMGAVAMTNQQWSLDAEVVCQTTGASGTVEAAGNFVKHTSTIASVRWAMANAAPITVNTVSSNNIQLSAQWSVANASNTITLRTLTIKALDNGN